MGRLGSPALVLIEKMGLNSALRQESGQGSEETTLLHLGCTLCAAQDAPHKGLN